MVMGDAHFVRQLRPVVFAKPTLLIPTSKPVIILDLIAKSNLFRMYVTIW